MTSPASENSHVPNKRACRGGGFSYQGLQDVERNTMARLLLLWTTGALPILRQSWRLRRTMAVDDALEDLRDETNTKPCQKLRQGKRRRKKVDRGLRESWTRRRWWSTPADRAALRGFVCAAWGLGVLGDGGKRERGGGGLSRHGEGRRSASLNAD